MFKGTSNYKISVMSLRSPQTMQVASMVKGADLLLNISRNTPI